MAFSLVTHSQLNLSFLLYSLSNPILSLSLSIAKLPYCAHSSNQWHENSGLKIFKLLPTIAAVPRWRLQLGASNTSLGVPQLWKKEMHLCFYLGLGLSLSLGLCAKHQRNVCQRPTTSATTTGSESHWKYHHWPPIFLLLLCWFGSWLV